jgi:hypothetical protein
MKDFFSTEGEVPGKENLSALNLSMQHEVKVQRFIEEGNMAPHEVALYMLSHGSTVQKISMLQHLGRTLKESDAARVTQVVHELNDAMWTQDIELQCAAPPALISILPMLNASQVTLLLGGAKTMLEVRAESVRKAWSLLVLEMSAFLDMSAVTTQLIALALKKGEHSEPHDQRVFGCQLIGRLCRRMDAASIVSTILNKAMNLCQDTETSVRVAMCGQLGEVARAVGLVLTKDRITAELFELLVDEEKLVSRAAFTALIDLVEFFDPPYRREHFYPIIKSYISSPPEEVLSLLIDEFGRFMWKIKSDIQCNEDITLFSNFFRQSAMKADPEVRRLCAFNLPAVVASLPISVYPTHLSQIQKSLAVDTNPSSRRAIAAGMHELCVLLGDKAALFLKDSFVALVQDPVLQVRTMIAAHLAPLLGVFAVQLKGEERDSFFATIAPHIVTYEVAVHKDWRKVSSLFNSFREFPKYFGGAVLHEKFLPLLVNHLVSGAAAIKEQCAELVVLFSSHLNDNTLKVEVFSKLVADFGRSTSCFNRTTYALVFRHCANHYSRKFLRDRLFEPLLELSKDPVVNVRLQFIKGLPQIRRCLKPPVEADLLKKFTEAVQRLRDDADPEVQAAIAEVLPDIEDIDADFARQVALRMTNAPDDVQDKAFEDAEGDLLEVAKEQEKLERRQKLREMLQGENVGSGPKPGPKGVKRTTSGFGSSSAKTTTGIKPGVRTTLRPAAKK